MGILRRPSGALLFLMILAGVVYGLWRWGPSALPLIRDWTGMSTPPAVEGPAPSQALADSVIERVQTFRRGEDAEMALGGREVTSVLRYSIPGLIPSGILDPEVRFSDGRVNLGARVVMGAFPDLPDLGPILGILPDTLDVVLEASLVPFGEGESALLVHSVEASRIPIPRRLVPRILKAMGRVDRPSLPREALAVPLPAGLTSAYILTDSLILSSVP
jgi:hypothetical protein